MSGNHGELRAMASMPRLKGRRRRQSVRPRLRWRQLMRTDRVRSVLLHRADQLSRARPDDSTSSASSRFRWALLNPTARLVEACRLTVVSGGTYSVNRRGATEHAY